MASKLAARVTDTGHAVVWYGSPDSLLIAPHRRGRADWTTAGEQGRPQALEAASDF